MYKCDNSVSFCKSIQTHCPLCLFRELLPVQLNTDVHDPRYCRDNYFRIVATVNQSVANSMCPVSSDDFKGAPPLVISCSY